MRDLRKQVARLEHALGRTQAEHVIHVECLNLACDELGQDMEAFKKSRWRAVHVAVERSDLTVELVAPTFFQDLTGSKGGYQVR